MSETNEYPLMLYLDGNTSAANVIVDDAEGEAIAKGGGFLRAGSERSSDEKESLTATQIKEELTKRGIEFKGNDSRENLQAQLDEAIAEGKKEGEGEQ